MRAELAQAQLGFARWLSALDFVLSEPSELAILGPDALPMLRLERSTYRPLSTGRLLPTCADTSRASARS